MGRARRLPRRADGQRYLGSPSSRNPNCRTVFRLDLGLQAKAYKARGP